MSYSIKVLSSEDFEKLPYRHASIALGIADPKSNIAYVRYSAYPELNKYLIDHEFEHLIEDHPTDEIDGVRYKILGDLFNAGKGLFQSAGQSLFGGGGKQGFIPSIGRAIASPFQKAGSRLMNMFGGGGGGQQATNSYAAQNAIPQGANYNPFTGSQIIGGLAGSGSRKGFGGILDTFKNPSTLLGGLSLGAGLLKPFPQVPQLPGSVNQLRSQVQAGGSQLGQQAKGVISSNLAKQFNPLTSEELTAATADLDRSRLQDIKRLEGLYASARPGTDYTTDTQYKQDLENIERQYAESKSNIVANRTRSAEEAFNVNQYRNIQAAIGASDQEMAQLAQIAQLDVEQIMAQLQLDYASALNFKQVFQNLGGTLLLQGLTGQSPLFGFNAGG